MSNGRESRVEGREAGEPAAEPASGGAVWMLLLVFGLGAAILITLQALRPKPASPYVGHPLPMLQASGWINVDKPVSNDDLRGKLVLVDFWATWCRPCVQGIPDLIEFNKRYRDTGVRVIGLTAEDGDDVAHVKRFVEVRDGMTWPVGYGARLPFQMLGIEGIPTYMLFDRSGTSVWGSHSLDGIEDVLLPLLAEKK